MAGPGNPTGGGLLAELLHPGGRLLERLHGVLRFDAQIYAEIERDPHAIPQAFAVVIVTAVLGALGHGSLAGIFLGIAGAIVVWCLATALVWGIGTLATGEPVHFPRLLRCLGFAYLWFVLLIGAGLPWIGILFSWASVGLSLASGVLAIRQVLGVSTERALTIYAVSLGIPILLLLALS
ncbi:MAG: hypothetical protein ACE5FG_12375 [Myxococcota bacterium]